MKVSISYPPLDSKKGTPLLSQNRQFQYFNSPTYIYPMVSSSAATLVHNAGHDIIWDDGIAEEKSYTQWISDLNHSNPDIIVIESKTPVIKRHWQIIKDIKAMNPNVKVALTGDHVTALPEESLKNSDADYILTGGDYDFLLLNLVNYLDSQMKLDPGIWFKKNGEIKSTGVFSLNHDLNNLPFINRDLTKWNLYNEKNGNFKKTPGTYTMVGRDCWWRNCGGCTFCSWTSLYPEYRVKKPELLVDEIGTLIEKNKVKEIFDDTGTFPVGNWLKKFTRLMIERGYNEKIDFSCNMRFGACSLEDYKLMKKAGFRMLLFGLESGSQRVLNELNKGVNVKEILNSCSLAKQAGLTVHITVMFGYPGASKEEEHQTYQLAKKLMDNKYVDTLQSTILVPYPGTKLYETSLKEGNLRFSPGEWEYWDMSQVLTKNSEMSPAEIKQLCDKTYELFLSWKYIFRKFLAIRSYEDIQFAFRGARKVLAHIQDFK